MNKPTVMKTHTEPFQLEPWKILSSGFELLCKFIEKKVVYFSIYEQFAYKIEWKESDLFI